MVAVPAGWIPVRTSEDLSQPSVALSDDGRANITDELSRGYVGVVPPKDAAWMSGQDVHWRLHPQTGDVLGIGPDGAGQASTERQLVAGYGAGGIAMVVFLVSWIDCNGATGLPSGPKLAACTLCGVLSGVGAFLTVHSIILTWGVTTPAVWGAIGGLGSELGCNLVGTFGS